MFQLKKKIHPKKYIAFQKTNLRRMPVKRVILFANVRDEQNIKEWVIHHLLLGFNLIYLFDHKSVKPLKEELKKFGNSVIVEHCNIESSPKMPLMNKAKNIASLLNVDWFIYLDADEFLILNQFIGVKQMLNHYYFADSVAINWLMFGTNYHVEKPKGMILENYTKSHFKLDQHVKTFVRPSAVINATNPHYYNMVNPNRIFALNGKLMKGYFAYNQINVYFNKSAAFIAHYYAQSESDYLERKIQRPTDDNNMFRDYDSELHSKNNEVDNYIPKNKYFEKVKKILEMY